NLDCLESSIQNLLSVLYPPFEATAPTLLSQLFQIIEGRYEGDALRCLLDFLVPAKHILDTVQQAACAQYSDVLFLCEGWPLCLHDRVVVHFAPIDPSLLQPGDFYLRVAPFCDQSARILVCSLLEEEGLLLEVVEETPIPETSYPCLFTRDWLEEINQGRHGTPLRRCLLAAQQGTVRLPWERVAVPDFVDGSTCGKPCPAQYPLATIQNSILAPSSNSGSALSVETRIRPAKHGIAVSLCLVDTKASSSSRPVRLKEVETEPKPVGLVSPNKWDSCPTGTIAGEYIDMMQAVLEEHQKLEMQKHMQSGPQTHRFPTQTQPAAQAEEKPCTPCMRRRQHGKVSKAQELRCRYRDSYQAAIQNPVAFEEERKKRNMLAVVEEGGSLSQRDLSLPESADECEGVSLNPPLQHQSHPTATAAICEESGEISPVSYWKPVEQRSQRETYGILYNEKRSATSAGAGLNPDGEISGQQQQVISARHPRVLLRPGEVSHSLSRTTREGVDPNPPQSRRASASDGRCSSLSTAVVDTSERCELVLVEGQNIRRRENALSCAEIPQLHVVKCKNSTAFRLVSPKISRRTPVAPGTPQLLLTSVGSAETQRSWQPASTHPRPDHLPLGSPDPGAHPLYLGVAALTGARDKTGRAVLELYGDHWGWSSSVTSQELFMMLLYFYSINRREIRETGMTIIFDARKALPRPQLYKALMALQEQFVQAVNSVVLLLDKESKLRPERFPGIRTEVVTSMKALFRLVDASQLSSHFHGSLSLSPCDWMDLHPKLFPFVSDLHEASSLLHRAIAKLDEAQRTDSTHTVQQCMIDQQTLMKDVLEDSRLVRLQREGGAILARLRKESDLKYPHCEDFSDAVESVSSLYNHVEEQAHVLVQRTNLSLEHLEFLLQLREFEGHFMQLQQWFNVDGERHLLEAESVEDPGDRMEQVLNSFTGFLIEANDRRHHAMSLVSEAEQLQQCGQSYPETEEFQALVSSFKLGLEDFLCRAEACGRELQVMVHVCDFCEQATALANECAGFLNQSHSRMNSIQDQDQNTPAFQDRFCQFSPDRFQEVKAEASALRSSRGMRLWNQAWLRCQEARQQLQERLQDTEDVLPLEANPASWCQQHMIEVENISVQTPLSGGRSLCVQSTPGPGHPDWEDIVSGEKDSGKREVVLNSGAANLENEADGNPSGKSEGSKVTPQPANSCVVYGSSFLWKRSAKKTEKEVKRRQLSRARSERDAAALSQSHTVGCQWFPWGRGLRVRSASPEVCVTDETPTGWPPAPVRSSSPCSHHGQPSCRILQEAQRYQVSRHGSFCSQGSCTSAPGTVGGNETSGLPRGSYQGGYCVESPQEQASSPLRLQRVLEELLLTEREYVRSLGYILTHYLPLLDRADVPQDLRGKRGVIFGNLEKLHDFHSHYFLPELEACEREAAMVARCFLRHSESFGLYALYSKNKPQSDALILHRPHDIFKRKQQELGDLMDLSSYLLRPIQRISKYSLLLQDVLTLAGSSSDWERERAEIQAAADLVQFQMRHGNDLLTMDAVRECDVNLKEQGQLVRQDEFTVSFRKKKCVRRVFLFEDLILFSKTKKTDTGNEVYVYKHSFKTSDVGMTHHSSMGSLCFEIWFRREKEDTYTFRASSMEAKKAWTADLERILWNQAAHSRELRLQERVFMGMGRKPFMDIQPSEAAICDRAVACVPPGRNRGLDYPRPPSIGSGSTASTAFSQSSSSSGRGSLPPA
uniref:Uncharacterized protein n=1 Tax=Tetraodon nigroviridis TaxID=99883 RepID=H3D374_TETNG